MPSVADELVRAYIAAAPEVIGRKKALRLMEAVQAEIARLTPTNAIGPIVGVRREAVQMLGSALRVMEAGRR